MKAQVKVYVHVEHRNILGFIEEDGVITCRTREAETIPGLVYTSIQDWFPIALIRVDADNPVQTLKNFEHPVTHKVTLDTLAAQFPNFVRKGNVLLGNLPHANLELDCGIVGGCCEHVS